MKLTFIGGVRGATGACTLVETGATSFLVGCGAFRGNRNVETRNTAGFPFDASSLDFVVLPDATAEYCGLLPRLVKQGFGGPVYCHRDAVVLCKATLYGLASLFEGERRRRLLAGEKRGIDMYYEPPFTVDDVRACLPLLSGLDWSDPISPCDGVDLTLYRSGAPAGSSSVHIRPARDGAGSKSVLFSGDTGPDAEPSAFPAADFLVLDAPWGDRDLPSPGESLPELEALVERHAGTAGHYIFPADCDGRGVLLKEALEGLVERLSLKGGPRVTLFFGPDACRARERPAGDGPAFIVCDDAMCTAGPVLSLLDELAWRDTTVIVQTAFQGAGTLGRRMRDGCSHLDILGDRIRFAARVVELPGLSFQAGRSVLRSRLELSGPDSYEKVFVVRGEETALFAAERDIDALAGRSLAYVPLPGDRIDLDELDAESLRTVHEPLEDDPSMRAGEMVRDELAAELEAFHRSVDLSREKLADLVSALSEWSAGCDDMLEAAGGCSFVLEEIVQTLAGLGLEGVEAAEEAVARLARAAGGTNHPLPGLEQVKRGLSDVSENADKLLESL